MGVVNEAIAKKTNRIITSRCKNMVDLCVTTDEGGKSVYFVLVKTAKQAVFIEIDEFLTIAHEFGEIVNQLPKKKV